MKKSLLSRSGLEVKAVIGDRGYVRVATTFLKSLMLVGLVFLTPLYARNGEAQ